MEKPRNSDTTPIKEKEETTTKSAYPKWFIVGIFCILVSGIIGLIALLLFKI